MERECNERHHVFYYNECKRVETALQRSIHQRISKGSLIGMCLDIIIREKKAREEILDLMQNLLMNMVFQNHLMIMNFC
jgi:phosphoribosylformylglycinamidine (FGAM) synthase PurS component